MIKFNPDRRNFLKLTSAAAGSTFILGINWGCHTDQPFKEGPFFSPNAWLKIEENNEVTVIVAESEMGQGPYTLMPMMVAEELEVAWESIKVERASVDPVYGYQMTGGSSSIKKGWSVLRQAGAVAREMFLLAGSAELSVDVNECHASQGKVIHGASNMEVSYGDLINRVQGLPLPETINLKEHGEFDIIGQPVQRKDILSKVNGSAEFGIDIHLPDQLFATVIHSPVFGNQIKTINKNNALSFDGAIDVFEIQEGVAVVAKDTWTAFKMAKEVNIEWQPGHSDGQTTLTILDGLKSYQSDKPTMEFVQGSVNVLEEGESKVLSSQYTQPFHAHMAMEPMNCTAWFKQDGDLEIWAPTQSPSAAYGVARKLTQSKLERKVKELSHKVLGGYDQSVAINTTLLGGGFGRRLQQDYVSEAVQIAEKFQDPVQLVWNREEDVQHDFYHPMTFHEMKAVLNKDKMPVSWEHIIRGGGVSLGGAKHEYDIPNKRIRVYDSGRKIPTGPWRSVAPHYNIFAVEHFLDELALKGGHDPLDYRLKLLNKSPRLRHVLELAADKINWNGSVNGSLSYGIAAAYSFGSYVAQILELEEFSKGSFHVSKVICAIDCGIVINPDIVKQQMEGSIIFGLSAATKSKITIKDGRVEQSNFHDYPILRMDEVPEMDILIVDSMNDPQGIGEPAVPPVAPALANAVLAQSGFSVKELPMKLS